ncbi:MAG TPA: PilZ domain-containing protein [Polyangia bacterium]|nr:PilZ domain-containing protein [Polyangia bacterium]
MWLFGRLARSLKNGSTSDGGEAPPADERRKHARHPFGAPTMVVLPGEPSGVRAFIRDISKGGCLLDTEAKVQVGARLSLAFLSKSGGHCHAVGCVVRVADNRHFGVQFSQVNMAFLGFVGSVSSTSPEGRGDLIAAMRGSTIEIDSAP